MTGDGRGGPEELGGGVEKVEDGVGVVSEAVRYDDG